MILIGLSGGLASGKSMVAKLLARRGAAVLDADEIAHQVIEPGRPANQRIVERFGSDIRREDGSIDRSALAAIVFSDAAARRDLEAITHPDIYAEIGRRLEVLRERDVLAVLDAALLVETLPDRGRSLGMRALVVVAAHPAEQVERAVRDRGMSHEAAQARLEAQAAQARKLAAADYILDNRGTPEDLELAVGVLWDDLEVRFGLGGREWTAAE